MAYKVYTIEIEGFPLHPVGGGVQAGCSVNVGLINIGKYFKPDAYIIYKIMQVVNHSKFPCQADRDNAPHIDRLRIENAIQHHQKEIAAL